MTRMEDVANTCKSLRVEAGFSLGELSELLDIPKNRINAIEHGKTYIRDGEAKEYSIQFKVPIERLLSPKQYETKYSLITPLATLKEELGSKWAPRLISAKTGIDTWRIHALMRTDKARTYASTDEIQKLAKYFDKKEEYFMTDPKEVLIRTNHQTDISKEPKKEVAVSVPEPVAPEQDDNLPMVSIWRDKATRLHRELNAAKAEIEFLKNNQGKSIDDPDVVQKLKSDMAVVKARYNDLNEDYSKVLEERDRLAAENAKLLSYKEKLFELLLEKYEKE